MGLLLYQTIKEGEGHSLASDYHTHTHTHTPGQCRMAVQAIALSRGFSNRRTHAASLALAFAFRRLSTYARWYWDSGYFRP